MHSTLRPSFAAILLAVFVSFSTTMAFVSPEVRLASKQQQQHRVQKTAFAMSSPFQQQRTKDNDSSMKQDIEEMRQEALKRLAKLTEQMEEFKADHEKHLQETKAAAQAVVNEPASKATNSLDSLEGDMTKHMQDAMAADTEDPITTSLQASSSQGRASDDGTNKHDLLDDTRWKIVMNIGREPGTWMDKDWGASGDRLLFELVVDFTSDVCYQRDEFFQSIAGVKELDVVEAWIFPTGVGRDSIGRRPVKIKDVGAYRVLPEQGPMGTDIVRMYFDLEEDVQQKVDSDVVCPKGRLYATCGYFPMRDRATTSPGHKVVSMRDILNEQQRDLTFKYEQLQLENEQDERLFSMDQLNRMKRMYQLRQEIDKVQKSLQEAKQREPERSQLRLSRDGTVGLSKEGGVCCKVHKGLTAEYHIVGRMELASIDHPDDDDDNVEHDDYEDLVHKLHP